MVKPGGRGPLGRPTLRWEDNIKIDLREVELGGMERIDLAQDRGRALMIPVIKFPVP